MPDKQTVFIVDDDEAVRDSLSLLMRSVALDAEAFPSAQEFLDAFDAARSGCLVLDVRMPGMSGLELVERLRERKVSLPIIFITGHGDIPMAVAAMKMGAIDFIPKPFRDQDLLDRIQQALQQDAERRGVLAEREAIRSRLQDLTPREREVLDKLLEGKANKVIALELELSQRTVELHRARIMDKMGARSLAALVQQVLLTRQ